MALAGALHAAEKMMHPEEAVPRCFAELALALLVGSVPTTVAHILGEPRELWTARPPYEIAMMGVDAGDALPQFVERLVRGEDVVETITLPDEVLYLLPEAESFSADDPGLRLITDCLKREAEKAHTVSIALLVLSSTAPPAALLAPAIDCRVRGSVGFICCCSLRPLVVNNLLMIRAYDGLILVMDVKGHSSTFDTISYDIHKKL